MDNQGGFSPFQPQQPPQPEQGPQPTQPPLGTTPPSPTPSTNNFIVQPDEPRKGHKGLIATIIVLCILLIGALGTIAFLLFFQPKADKTTKQDSAGATTESAQTNEAKELISKVKNNVTDQLSTANSNMKISDGTSAPIFKPDDKKYAVISSEIGISLSIDADTSTYDRAKQSTVEKVVNDTFKGDASLKLTSNDWQNTYQNATVICTVSSESSPVTVSCANKKEYTPLITQVAPFAEAFFASNDSKNYQTVTFAAPKISQKTSGYRNATLGIGSMEAPVGWAAGLFYAKDGNWTYWRATQSIMLCSDYNNSDLQRAFEGEPCIDTNNANSTVKVKN